MLTVEQLDDLSGACSRIASDNWDGLVNVSQSGEGVLFFESFDEEDEPEETLIATPYGTAQGGEELYQYKLGSWSADHLLPVGTLTPKMIVGLLGL